VALFLVRHGSALDRSRWPDDDLERPLDDRGRVQATSITAYLADRHIRRVWSSQATRCVDTVAGLAEAQGVEVEIRRELTEGARPNDLLELLRANGTNEANGADLSGDADVVMCSHGDLIPEVLNRLLRDGMLVVGPRGCKKGSIWELETRGREITRGVYTSAP
jgi:phosphohistidine phosphatase SixA